VSIPRSLLVSFLATSVLTMRRRSGKPGIEHRWRFGWKNIYRRGR
jgi:hypothetical protein